MAGAIPTDPSFESILAFWDDAGLDVASARALVRDAARRAAAGPATAPKTIAAPLAASLRPTEPAGRPRQPAGPVEQAQAAAAAAASLDELAQAIDRFDGCPLKASARRSVFGDGVQRAPVLVIGEAPGREEDAEGRPFVGLAGQLLDRMLAAIGLGRAENCFITNAVFWRPPGNRNPDAGELAVCRPFVERAIALSAPRLILFVGGVAAQAMLQKAEGVMRLRGRRFAYRQAGLTDPINAMVILHPAYLLRRPQEKGLAWTDLQAIAAWLDELGVAREAAGRV